MTRAELPDFRQAASLKTLTDPSSLRAYHSISRKRDADIPFARQSFDDARFGLIERGSSERSFRLTVLVDLAVNMQPRFLFTLREVLHHFHEITHHLLANAAN